MDNVRVLVELGVYANINECRREMEAKRLYCEASRLEYTAEIRLCNCWCGTAWRVIA